MVSKDFDLTKLKSFPKLLDYLRDELDWPIEDHNMDDLTFEYNPKELGIIEEHQININSIQQLRPLSNNQPWGIFFIRFDDNKLPVVALRRLLSKLVLNKRSSSNSGDRASWHESDLLLISQTGNLGTQSISFAHFAANPEKTDLPILKVLGWDDATRERELAHYDARVRAERESQQQPNDHTADDARLGAPDVRLGEDSGAAILQLDRGRTRD